MCLDSYENLPRMEEVLLQAADGGNCMKAGEGMGEAWKVLETEGGRRGGASASSSPERPCPLSSLLQHWGVWKKLQMLPKTILLFFLKTTSNLKCEFAAFPQLTPTASGGSLAKLPVTKEMTQAELNPEP